MEKTVLIVDDDECIKNLLEEILTQQGYRTIREVPDTGPTSW